MKTTLETQHIKLVEKIAGSVKKGLPESVLMEDLIQSGYIGLLEAQKSFDADNKSASFNTFASRRIKGAMIDSLRKADWTPRSVNKNRRLINDTRDMLEKKLQREIYNRDIVEALDISAVEFNKMENNVHCAQTVSSEAVIEECEEIPSQNGCVFQKSVYTENVENVVAAMEKLKKQEAQALTLYYEEDLTLKEVGTILGVHESRVSQIITKAVGKLKSKLNNKGEIL